MVYDIRRKERLEDLKGDDKLRYDSDIKAVDILLLGPLHYYQPLSNYKGNMGSCQRTYERYRDDQARTVKDFEWFKDKMLLAQAQEARVVLDEEQHDFLADSLEETGDCEDLLLQASTNFKANHVDAYDSDYDDEATVNEIFIANLLPVGSLNDDTIAPRYDSDTLSEGDSDVISYTDYILTIGDDANNYVPPPIQKDDMMLSITEQMKSQVKKCTKRFTAEVKEMKEVFEQMEDEVDQCSVAKKCFEIEKKQLLINNDRLLEENIAIDIMCTYLCSLNEVDNCRKCKSLNIVLLDLQEPNKSLSMNMSYLLDGYGVLR
uniref:Uncharacterized protein n=1 Tax=Tanacetum cinerariifolium TaxID=118510 RepID=A0A6L2JU59_TANCI|nr:hypothetical protein [Tanacetum cinerariifolium]